MAATVVSVVIFLCGVLVGRGVRTERGSEAEVAELNAPADPTPQQAAAPAVPTPTGSDPTAAAAPPAVDDLTYFNRLQTSTPPVEKLKTPPASAKAAEKPAAAPRAAAPAPPRESAR